MLILRKIGTLCVIAIALTSLALGLDRTARTPVFEWAQSQVSLNGQVFTLYVADNQRRRNQGLMHVTDLPRHHGVVFVYDADAMHCMWMKNTLIELKVIFVDRDGKYLNDINMTPGDLTSRCASSGARYAIEINQGDLPLSGPVDVRLLLPLTKDVGIERI